MAWSNWKNWLLVTAAALILSACGGSSPTPKTDTTASAYDASGSTVLAAQAAVAASWTQCAWEGSVCRFSGTAQVRYGLNGVYVYKTATDSINCSNDAFGSDPAYGSTKVCEYLPSSSLPEETWTFCAREDGTCQFNGTAQVRYGLNGSYVYKTATGSIACTNAAFGNDPAYGYTKTCEYLASSAPPPPPPANSWKQCAWEWGVCRFNGAAQVRYGLNGSYVYKNAVDSIDCNNDTFGNDPAYGYTKVCEYLPSTPPPVVPVANGDNYSVQSGQSLSIAAPGVLSNDSPGTGGGSVTVVGSTQALHGTVTVNANGSFTYQPTQGYTGADNFTYTIQNTAGQQATTTVTITVTGVTPPVGSWTYCATEGGTCRFSGTAQVRYGLNGVYVYKTATGSIGCNNTAFGSDPVHGYTKTCEYQPPAPPSPFGQDASQYVLTFQDEFDGSSLDLNKWNTRLWYDSDPGLSNYRVSNGSLKIWMQKNRRGQWVAHNRTLSTHGKFEQTYGYFEIEAKFAKGPGAWGTFWLYSHQGDDRPEIDIVEVYSGGGVDAGWADANAHPVDYNMTLHKANADYSMDEYLYWARMKQYSPYENGMDLSAGFHKYGVKWEPSGITFYLDGKQIGPKYVDSTGYYSKPMYALVTLWIGSEWNAPDATTVAGSGNSMEVNYVRAWQLK